MSPDTSPATMNTLGTDGRWVRTAASGASLTTWELLGGRGTCAKGVRAVWTTLPVTLPFPTGVAGDSTERRHRLPRSRAQLGRLWPGLGNARAATSCPPPRQVPQREA